MNHYCILSKGTKNILILIKLKVDYNAIYEQDEQCCKIYDTMLNLQVVHQFLLKKKKRCKSRKKKLVFIVTLTDSPLSLE